MKKLLITGGCGYVGRELVARAGGKYEIHVADNLLSGEYRLKKMNRQTFRLHEVDIRDSDAVALLLEEVQPDIVVHLAAIHFIPQCEQDPHLALSTNILPTVNILSRINSRTKFIFMSSGAVYAPSSEALHEESSAVAPSDVYGWSKLHGENYCSLFAKRKNLDVTIVRLFNVIGSGETNPHILPEVISQLKNGNKSLKLGNISSKRDFIDVRDVADGLMRLCEVKQTSNVSPLIVNLASGTTYRMMDLLEIMREVSGINFDIIKDERKFRTVDNPVMLASTDKLYSVTKWKPRYALHETVLSAWNDDEMLPSIEVK